MVLEQCSLRIMFAFKWLSIVTNQLGSFLSFLFLDMSCIALS